MNCRLEEGFAGFPFGRRLADQEIMLFECIKATTRDHYREVQEICTFSWRNTQYQVNEILDRWYEGYIDPTRLPLRYFRVKTADGQTFIIRYHALFDAWSILVPG